jgi:hypothetical protein
MINDPIVKEVRKVRQEIFAAYGSLRAYHKAILEKQKEFGSRLVTLSAKRVDLDKRVGQTGKIAGLNRS